MVCHKKVLHNYFIPCPGKYSGLLFEIWAGIRYVTHCGKVELNTVEYTTAFLNSDCLYFLWHGIKCHTNETITAMPDLHCRIRGTYSFLLKKS